MTSKLSDLFRDRYPNTYEGTMGLEFECESNTNLPAINAGTWRSKTDGSLRAEFAYEYVTQQPLPFSRVHDAIERLLAKVDTQEYQPLRDSRNTSWHVHLNALHFTPTEFMTRVFTWWMLEPIMMMHCAPHRRQNLYCLPVRDAGTQLNAINEEMFIRFATRPSEVPSMLHDHRRYCAQNLTALGKYGSVEYRCMDGTLDLERIKKWTTYLNNLWYANPYENPDHLFSTEDEHGVGRILEELGIDLTSHLSGDVSEQAKENTLALHYVSEQMPYDNWDNWQRRIERSHISRPALPKVQPTVYNTVGLRDGIVGEQANMIVVDEVQPVPAQTYERGRPMTFVSTANTGRRRDLDIRAGNGTYEWHSPGGYRFVADNPPAAPIDNDEF